MKSISSSTPLTGAVVALFLLAASCAQANSRPLPGALHVDLFAYGPAETPGRIARVYIASGPAPLPVADDVGEVAMNYYVFQLMGYPNLRVLWR
jgi:hypothetical protein